MQRDVIDGVPVLWAQAPGPLEAALVFGCGVRDETFRCLGVTQLVERLATSTLPRLHHEHGSAVTLFCTEFTVSGSAVQVTAFLTRICEALSALPLERREREAGVLAAEGIGVLDTADAELLSLRYGTLGAGVASWTGPGPDRIPAEAVRDTAARFFHADNAVLVLTGPPPAGLRLLLPRGIRPARGAAQPVLTAGPAWFQADVPGPGLALHGDLGDPALVLAHAVFQERVAQRVRHQEGLALRVGTARLDTGAGRGEFVLSLDAREGQERYVAELLWHEAQRMAGTAVTEDELAEELAGFREVWLDPRSAFHELAEAATCLLFGLDHQDAPARLDALAKVTPEQARQAFCAALATALLVVPCGAEVELRRRDGPPLPRDVCSPTRVFPSDVRVFKPSLYQRALSPTARAARLGVGPCGLWYREGDAPVRHVAFDEVVGVEWRGAGRVVFGSRGCFIPVLPELWAKIGPAVAAIDAAVPRALHYPASALLADGDG
ncbi:insulinase family protein [Streptomyces sp. SID5910]|uniref:insulinase family protein n=1 Tax=Streptomyces sp. SID5910 TaxID=2690312 RepID=UPI0013712DD2|nr:insulinase family protein [Streptomyces sp. SID5910]MYR41020.1 hypothetical protein [Streptomyces sp. SID5910]